MWRRNGAVLPGASALAYTPVAADSGQVLTFEVTPVAVTGKSPGTTVSSAGILIQNSPPTATDVSITGTAEVGQALTGGYTYGDVDGDAEGLSTFRWLRDGTAIPGAVSATYTTVAADDQATLTFEVTPVAAAGASPGTPALSAGFPIGMVAHRRSRSRRPTSDPTTTATSPFLTIGGIVTGDNAISSVSWATDRAFTGTARSATSRPDTAQATPGASTADVPLLAGNNVITVTATDTHGRHGNRHADGHRVRSSSTTSPRAPPGRSSTSTWRWPTRTTRTRRVAIQYLKEDGTTVTQALTLAAQSRQTILVDGLAGLDEHGGLERS